MGFEKTLLSHRDLRKIRYRTLRKNAKCCIFRPELG